MRLMQTSLSGRRGPVLRTAFIALFAAAFFCSPALSLFAGILFALTLGNPLTALSHRISKIMLQACVVGLGFGMNFHEALASGRDGMIFTIGSVLSVMVAGILLGRLLRVGRRGSYLISAGTAICGGSAIAAVAPVIDADEDETSFALATIFVLNAAALFLFPLLGRWLGLSEAAFGTWAAIAIHDTSSVVGAGAAYGEEALRIATTVKLTRALWIVPLSLVSMLLFRRRGVGIRIPWFIGWFLVAMALNTWVDLPGTLTRGIAVLSRAGLSATLFLIGSGLSLEAVRRVGLRPLLLGILLWVLISVLSLAVILLG